MSVDWEAALISSIVQERDMRSVIRMKIGRDYFGGTITKAAFMFLESWYANPAYGDTPSWESFQDAFTAFEPVHVEDSIVAICDKVREAKLHADLAGIIQDVAEMTSQDPRSGFEMLKKKVVTLTANHTVDEASDIRASVGDIRDEYFRMKENPGALKGYAYPWPALNEATLGLQNQQLVFFYGRPKTKKSWLFLEAMRCFHAHGQRPLIFSQELSDTEMKRRFVALNTGVNYTQFLTGTLPEDKETEFLDALDAFEQSDPIIIDRLSAVGGDVESELLAKIDEYKPTVVGIDGMQCLSSDWKEIAEMLKAFKRACQSRKIPMLGTTHANRSRNKGKAEATDGADDFAYGDAYYQYADVCLRITCDIENMRKKEVVMFTSAIREGKSVMFSVNTYVAENFTQKNVISFGDSENDVDDEAEEADIDNEESERE